MRRIHNVQPKTPLLQLTVALKCNSYQVAPHQEITLNMIDANDFPAKRLSPFCKNDIQQGMAQALSILRVTLTTRVTWLELYSWKRPNKKSEIHVPIESIVCIGIAESISINPYHIFLAAIKTSTDRKPGFRSRLL